jgi:hypothetical protein
VVLWTVLAGLFLMHGAASPAACTQGDTLVTAMAPVTMPAMPAAAPAGGAPGGAAVMSSPAPGRAAAPAGHAGTPASAAAPTAAGPALGSCCGGMLCSTRQPRDALAGLSLIPLAALAALVTVPARARPAAVFRRAWRPPGRPGLPLPLFLGVSRT